jgi:hypothetical protein
VFKPETEQILLALKLVAEQKPLGEQRDHCVTAISLLRQAKEITTPLYFEATIRAAGLYLSIADAPVQHMELLALYPILFIDEDSSSQH